MLTQVEDLLAPQLAGIHDGQYPSCPFPASIGTEPSCKPLEHDAPDLIPSGSLFAPARFLFESRESKATIQLIQHGLWLDIQVLEHHHGMEPEISCFVDHLSGIAAFGGDHCFCCLLSHFLEDGIDTLGIE